MTFSRGQCCKTLPFWVLLFLLPLSAAQAQQVPAATEDENRASDAAPLNEAAPESAADQNRESAEARQQDATPAGSNRAESADRPWSVGLAFGSAPVDSGISVPPNSDAEVEENNTGINLFIGYAFNQSFAIEGFYTSFGSASVHVRPGDVVIFDGEPYTYIGTGNDETMEQTTTFGVAGKLSRPVSERLTGYGKLGFHSWSKEFTDASGLVTYTNLEGDSGTGTLFGLGVEYSINDRFFLFLGYDNYAADGTVSFVHGGLTYRFRGWRSPWR